MEVQDMSLSIDGVIREDNVKKLGRPIFAKFKKHYCNQCGNRLKIVWITQMIHRDSPEADGKNLAFGPKIFFNQPIKYTFAIFECTFCKHRLSIDDQFYFEKPEELEKYEKKYGDYKLKDDYHSYIKSIQQKNTQE